MATITRRVAEFENGLVVVEFDYDDVSMSILTFRVTNNAAGSVNLRACRESNGKTISRSFPPGVSSYSVPQGGGAANRLILTKIMFEGVERLDGVSIYSGWSR